MKLRLELNTDRLAPVCADIIKISKKKPKYLIEDCHWMDEAGWLFFVQVMNHLRDCPVAFVLTKHILSTPPYLDAFSTPVALVAQTALNCSLDFGACGLYTAAPDGTVSHI